MDFNNSCWILVFITIFSFGNCLPLLNDNDDRYFGEDSDNFINQQPASVFDPGYNIPEDNRIEGILKRSGFEIADNYQRYPRIKEKVIIPFYSYGKNPGYYRSRPLLQGRPRTYFGYNPWNVDSYRRYPSSGYRF